MSLIIDLILILVFIMSIISGYRKGFVRSVMNIVAFTAAFLCGWLFTPALGTYYKEHIVLDGIAGKVSEAINSVVNSGIGSLGLDTLMAEKPDAFTDIISRFNVNIYDVEKYYSARSDLLPETAANKVSEFIADPIAAAASNILAFVTIFFAVIIVLKIATFILDLIFKLPVLNAANRVFGLLLGIVCGFLYVSVLIKIYAAVSPVIGSVFPEIYVRGISGSSMLVNLLKDFNIFNKLDANFMIN